MLLATSTNAFWTLASSMFTKCELRDMNQYSIKCVNELEPQSFRRANFRN
jgi:hypothetical protein